MKPSIASHLDFKKIHCLGAAGLAAIMLLSYLLGYRPLLIRYEEAKQHNTSLVDWQRKANELNRSQSVLENDLQRLQAALESSPLTLHKVSHRNERLALLTELALANDLVVDGVQTGEIIQADQYDKVPIQLSGQGGYPDCGRFLHRLTSEFPDMGVDSFELTGRSGLKHTSLAFTFKMTWYAAPSRVSLAE